MMFMLFAAFVMLASILAALRVWRDVRPTVSGVPLVEIGLLSVFLVVQAGLSFIIISASSRLGW